MAKKSFPLRIDDEVFDSLRHWAEDEFRSVNGQIEYLLREALRQSGRLTARRGRTVVTEADAAEEPASE